MGEPKYSNIDRKTALEIFNALTIKNIKKNGLEFPKTVMVRFLGNETIEFFEFEAQDPVMRSIRTKDQAYFTLTETPDTNGAD
jgi:hypothetical protein